jgi:hypothetical protein
MATSGGDQVLVSREAKSLRRVTSFWMAMKCETGPSFLPFLCTGRILTRRKKTVKKEKKRKEKKRKEKKRKG